MTQASVGTSSTNPESLRRRWIKRVLRGLPLGFGIFVWYVTFDYAPDFLYTDDGWSKYLLVTMTALAAAAALWAVQSQIKAKEASVGAASRAWVSPPVDFDRVAEELVSAASSGGGWCHYLGQYPQAQAPSPLSSAFALRTLMLTGYARPGVSVSGVRDWIMSRANADGGWSAQSQGDISRPEVTAIVAATLVQLWGADEATARASKTIESALSGGSDPMIESDSYVLSTVLEESRFLEVDPRQVHRVAQRLLDGALKMDDGRYCWAETLFEHDGGTPSSARTAHAVLALQSYARTESQLPHSFGTVLGGALDWLQDASLSNEVTKLVRYPSPGREEVNVPRHFTAALVSTALSQAGRGGSPGAERALRESWSRYRQGVWVWDSGVAPTYVTYYGLLAAVNGRIR